MLIRYCVSLHNYGLRFGWEMSSLLQQIGEHLPDIVIDAAVAKGHKNKWLFPPDLCEKYNRHVKLEYHATDRETFAYRGQVRNQQLRRALDTKADWLFYADADRTYHPNFFTQLAAELDKRRGCELLLAGRKRASTVQIPTDTLMWQARGEVYHYNAYFRTWNLPRQSIRSYKMATGGMQVVTPAAIMAKRGNYANPVRRHDNNMWTEGQFAKTDVIFRQSMGGSVMLDLPTILHLEHDRDKDAGKHLETQR
jgi:hypothetical protein